MLEYYFTIGVPAYFQGRTGCLILVSGRIFFNFFPGIQTSYNTPLEHTPTNPPRELWKESRLIAGVFQFGVLKQP